MSIKNNMQNSEIPNLVYRTQDDPCCSSLPSYNQGGPICYSNSNFEINRRPNQQINFQQQAGGGKILSNRQYQRGEPSPTVGRKKAALRNTNHQQHKFRCIECGCDGRKLTKNFHWPLIKFYFDLCL